MTSLKSVVPNVATASAAFGDLSADQQADLVTRQNSASAQGRNMVFRTHRPMRCSWLCPGDSRFGWRICRSLWPKSGSASRSARSPSSPEGYARPPLLRCATRSCSNSIAPRSRTLRAACPPSTTNCSRPWHNGLPRPPRASRAAPRRSGGGHHRTAGHGGVLCRILIACAVAARARDMSSSASGPQRAPSRSAAGGPDHPELAECDRK